MSDGSEVKKLCNLLGLFIFLFIKECTMRDMESWAVCYCHFKKCQCKCTFTVIMIDIFKKSVKLT
jgi:hypothetical protein